MTIAHHPPENMLARFAIGKLDEAEHLVVSVHIDRCPHCQLIVGAIEQFAGATMETIEPMPMSVDAFEAVLARVHEDSNPTGARRPSASAEPEDPDLPDILRHHRIGTRRRVAPGVSLRPIMLAGLGQSRAFLLQSAPGTRMLEHTHTGTELTCVLKGSFSHEGGRYAAGDFDFGDQSVDHRPIVGEDR
jgi:putative transcriptional regulator